MTNDEKIAYYLRDMRQRGIGRFRAAPPLNRLLWRLGIKIRPLAFASFWSLFWLCAGFYFSFFIILQWVGHHSITGLSVIVLGAAACGGLIAGDVRRRARKLALPRWEDYPSPCPTESSC
jgi:hypothetical protein